MKKSEELKTGRKNKFKCFLLAHILTLFFALANFSFAADKSFDFGQKNAYSEPFSKLIEFLKDKKEELENYDGNFIEEGKVDHAAEFNPNISSFLASVLGSVKDTMKNVFDSAKSFVFTGDNQNNFEYLSPTSEENAKEIENLKQQYESAIKEANELKQKFALLQNEMGKIKAGGVIVKEPVIEQRMVEKTIEKIISGLSAEASTKAGLSQTDLDSGISSLKSELANLNTNLTNQINNLSASASRQTSAVYNAVSLTNKIDSLSGTRLSNITVSGVTGLADSDIPDTITASNYLPLNGGTMTGNILMPASAYLNFGTGSGSSGYGFRDNSGTMQVKSSAGSWNDIAVSQWITSSNDIYYTTGNIGIGTTSPYAKLSIVGETVSSYFSATSTTASTFPYASTTALTVSGSAYIGSLNGPLQANNGLVSATTSVGYQYGGTGLTAAPSFGQMLRGTGSGYSLVATSTLGINTSDLTEGSNLFWTDNRFDNRLSATTTLPNIITLANLSITGSQVSNLNTLWDNRMSATTSLQNIITLANLATVGTITSGTWNGTTIAVNKGGTGQTSFGQGWLNSDGSALSASTSPTVNYLTATSTAATSTFPYLSVTTNSNLGTVVGGTWQGTAVGDGYLTKSGDWTGTLDTYEAANLLARANHTGTQGVATLSNYDFSFSNNYGTNNLTASTTMPWWAQGGLNASSTSHFLYASSTALTISGNSYLGTVSSGAWNGTAVSNQYGGTGLDSSALTGLAQIVAGTWSASSTLSAAYGGTGWNSLQANTVLLGNGAGRLATTSAGTDGYVLALSSGIPTWLATSTLSTITGTLTVGKGGTGIDSSALTGLAQIVAGTWSASSTLSTAYGGTGWNNIASGYAIFGNGAGALATSSSFYWDNSNSRLGIGTTTPDSKLTVFNNADDSAIEFSSASGSTYKWTMGLDYSDAGKFKIASSTALGSIDRFTIDGNGYVGIGTSTPARRLDVADSGNNNPQLRLSRETNIYTDLSVAQTTGDLSLSLYGANADDISLFMPDGSTGANLWVCEGAACPNGISFTGGGNLFVEGVIKYATSTTPKTRRSIILTAAGAIVPTTSGAAKTQVDGTNHSYYVLDFDASSDEAAFWQWTMPDSYDNGSIDITYYWEAGATSGDSILCFQAKGLSANSAEDIDSALSSAVCETDTAQANANDLASMTETNATSNFAAGEYVTFKVFRDADAGGDTMTGDARLVKVKIEYGVATESD